MPQTFDIGLVMAGAVSAGAYTGGSIDFLLQALDAWEAARSTPGTPSHEVKIKVVTGASAGGITAAILGSSVREVIPPVDANATDQMKKANKLYDAWVNRVSIERLLEHKDLSHDPQSPVQSLLDSSVLDEIADRVMSKGETGPVRPYIANPLLVSLTVTNLRGVPYQIGFQGIGNTQLPYVMTLHGDQLTFALHDPERAAATDVTEAVTLPDKAIALNVHDVGSGSWPKFQTAALATGAFPFGLATRTLHQPAKEYSERVWLDPTPQAIQSAMNVPGDFDYEFTCVDGGMIDNEPIGLAREQMQLGQSNNKSSALILIDPFPNAEVFEEKYEFPRKFSLFKMFPTLVGALINQSRFKPSELTRAIDPKVFNQFLLSPVRDNNGTAERFAIACGGLGGFAGFLSKEFREHDFRLGRQNARRFLREIFVLPEDHELFSEWQPAAKDKYRITRNGQNFLPIIPLMDSVSTDEKLLKWPATFTQAKLRQLRAQLEDRSKQVVERLIQKIEGSLTQFLLRRVWWAKRDSLLDDIMEKYIEKDLKERKLMA